MPNKSLDASGGSVFLNFFGAAKGALIRAAASTSMKPGRVKRKIREDWFTLLFEVTRVRPTCVSQGDSWPHLTVRRSSFSDHEFWLTVCAPLSAAASR